MTRTLGSRTEAFWQLFCRIGSCLTFRAYVAKVAPAFFDIVKIERRAAVTESAPSSSARGDARHLFGLIFT